MIKITNTSWTSRSTTTSCLLILLRNSMSLASSTTHLSLDPLWRGSEQEGRKDSKRERQNIRLLYYKGPVMYCPN